MLVRRNMFDNAFEDLVAMQRDMFRLFNRTIGTGAGVLGEPMPMTEAYYKDGQYVLTLALPGMEPSTVDVTTQGTTLTVRGERPAVDVPADDMTSSEIPAGKFEWVFALPHGLETDKVEATWKHGLLTVGIPVATKLLPRKVPVEVAKA